MREQLTEIISAIPISLKKQILYRFAMSLFSLILLAISLHYNNVWLWMPFLFFSFGFSCIGFYLFYITATEHYVTVTGECNEIEYNLMRNKAKFLYIHTSDFTVKLRMKPSARLIKPGCIITVYVANKTPVYEQDHFMLVNDYLALKIGH